MEEFVKKLMSVSEPKNFRANDYICYEGQTGSEMYIILKGRVGIYIDNPLGMQVQIAVMGAGDFFGEMAVFDDLPRSASCAALEDTVCVAITKDKLLDFIRICPDITLKVLENMSGRIRKMNDELYRSDAPAESVDAPDFELPKDYDRSHDLSEPPHKSIFIKPLGADCPVCGKHIIVNQVRRKDLALTKMDADCRRHYKDCEPMWYDVWDCPYCHYSAHYLRFFGIKPSEAALIRKLLKEKTDPVIAKIDFLKTPFDHTFLKYIQAVYITDVINPHAHLTAGMLWLNLYWLFCDAKDEKMRRFCAEKAAERLIKALENADISIPDEYSRQSVSMSAAFLLAELGRTDEALTLCDAASKYSDGTIKIRALRFKEQIMGK